jgi:hypothetical protein
MSKEKRRERGYGGGGFMCIYTHHTVAKNEKSMYKYA